MKTNRLLSCFFFAVFLAACGGPEGADTENQDLNPDELIEVQGGKFQGGVLKVNSIENYTSLFPPSVNDIYSTHIVTLGYEGLLRLDQKTLDVQPCLSESFTIDNNKKVYTFNLRKGVKFVDNECFADGKGREVVADDFKYCLEFLCSSNENNKWISLFRGRIKGATEYSDGNAQTVSGITVVDDYTIKVELVNPYSGFPYLLAISAAAVYPKEAIDKYGYEAMGDKIIGTGPFKATEIKNGEGVKFTRNNDYWRKDEFGNQLPLLSGVDVSFIKDKNEELKAFQNEELDMVWGIPVEEIPNIMGTLEEAKKGENTEFEVQSINSLNVQYYGFLYTDEVFSDVNVRKAFNYAIDRDSLTDYILEGEGIAAHNGFVPEIQGYPSESVNGFYFNPELAREYLEKAGYPGGKGFPATTLHLSQSGGINKKVAEALTGMIKENLGIDITLNVVSMAELYPQAEKGELPFWRFGWIADYPDPSNFLYLFHGKNIVENQETSINYFRYQNPEFDRIYEEALNEIDFDKRMSLYAKADQILMDDAVIMPLYFNTGIRLIDPSIHGFPINQMEYRDLSTVYYKVKEKNKVRVYDNLSDEEGDSLIEEEK